MAGVPGWSAERRWTQDEQGAAKGGTRVPPPIRCAPGGIGLAVRGAERRPVSAPKAGSTLPSSGGLYSRSLLGGKLADSLHPAENAFASLKSELLATVPPAPPKPPPPPPSSTTSKPSTTANAATARPKEQNEPELAALPRLVLTPIRKNFGRILRFRRINR